jgi:hypothetical protein
MIIVRPKCMPYVFQFHVIGGSICSIIPWRCASVKWHCIVQLFSVPWGSVKQFEGCSGFYYSAIDFGMWVMQLVLLPLIITKF